jgi:formamidopyrimidine-DNA glycosylase
MPEITEVLTTAHYLLTKLKSKYITKINIISGRYTHQKLEGLKLIAENTPLKILNIDSKGKFMWFKIKSNNKIIYIMCNFGLTGEWSLEKNDHVRIEFEILDKKLDKNYKLYFSDQRNFGIISITDDYDKLEFKLNKLARDYLKEPFTDKDFFETFIDFINKKDINKKKLLIKFLMDQDANATIGSGIGNYIATESLYEAKLSPYRKLDTLTKKEIKTLNKAIQKIIKQSYIYNKSGYIKTISFPNYLPNINLNKNLDYYFEFKVYQQEYDKYNNPVKADKIIPGRTTYWVPKVQI